MRTEHTGGKVLLFTVIVMRYSWTSWFWEQDDKLTIIFTNLTLAIARTIPALTAEIGRAHV